MLNAENNTQKLNELKADDYSNTLDSLVEATPEEKRLFLNLIREGIFKGIQKIVDDFSSLKFKVTYDHLPKGAKLKELKLWGDCEFCNETGFVWPNMAYLRLAGQLIWFCKICKEQSTELPQIGLTK